MMDIQLISDDRQNPDFDEFDDIGQRSDRTNKDTKLYTLRNVAVTAD